MTPARRLAGAAAALFLLAGGPAAHAQPPGGLPNLRVMAGRPLPVADLAVGTVIVRVVDKLPSNPFANTAVNAQVSVQGGATTSPTATTNADGRASFENLPRGAEFSAQAVVNGETLSTSRFTVPATGGVRVMLIAGIGVDAPSPSEAPIETDSAENRFDTAALVGRVDPARELPAGVLEIRVNNADGQAQPAAVVRVGQVEAGGQIKGYEATTDGTGLARLADLPSGGNHAFVAVVHLDGVRVGSQPFRMPAEHGMRATLEPLRSTTDVSAIGIVEPSYLVVEFREGGIVVQENLSIGNHSDQQWEPGTGGLRFYLPKEHLQAQAIPGGTPLEIEPQSAMVLRSPILPTASRQAGAQVRYAFLIPSHNDDELVIERKYPLSLKNTLLLVPMKNSNLDVRVPGIEALPTMTTDSGTTVRRYKLPDIATGATLTLTVTGIPTVERWGHKLAATVTILLMVLGVGASVRTRNSAERDKLRRQRDDLNHRREKLFAELVALEERRRAAAGDAAALERVGGQRAELVGKLETVYREIAAFEQRQGS